MAHWADNHVGGNETGGGKIRYREAAKPPSGRRGALAGLLVAVVIIGCGGAGYWAWSQGYFAAEESAAALPPDEPVALAPRVRPDPVAEAPEELTPLPDVPPAAAPAGLDAATVERIERGIALLQRQKDEKDAKAQGYQAQLDQATKARKWPADKPTMTYEQWIRSEITKAKAAGRSTFTLDAQLSEFLGKVGELGTRRDHELEVAASLQKRIDAERAKLVP